MNSNRFTLSKFGVYALLTLGAVFVLYPFFYMVMNSVKPGPEILNQPTQLPSRVTFSGYLDVFRRLNMFRLFGNSLLISGSVTLLNTALSALAAYAVAKIPFPGRDRLFAFMLSTMMIPGVLFLIPTYVIIYNLGWVGQYHALIIPSAVSVYNIFLIRQFMVSIPNELLEAGRLDGASELTLFWRIMLPMSRPVLATVAILTFIGSWNDFFGPLIYLNSEDMYTVALGVARFSGGPRVGPQMHLLMAASFMATLPVLVAFFLAQRLFIQGIVFSGVKG